MNIHNAYSKINKIEKNDPCFNRIDSIRRDSGPEFDAREPRIPEVIVDFIVDIVLVVLKPRGAGRRKGLRLDCVRPQQS